MTDSFTPDVQNVQVVDELPQDSFVPDVQDSFVPDEPHAGQSAFANLITAGMEVVKDIPAQIQDLLTMPSRLLGLPHPPMISKLSTETVPYIMEKATTPIGDFDIPSLSYEDVKSIMSGKFRYSVEQISPSTMDIAWYGLMGATLARNSFALVRWNYQLDKLIKTEEVRGAVMNNMPAFENLMKQVGIKTEGMDLTAKTNFILSQAQENPKIGSAVIDLVKGKMVMKPPATTAPPIETTIAQEGIISKPAEVPIPAAPAEIKSQAIIPAPPTPIGEKKIPVTYVGMQKMGEGLPDVKLVNLPNKSTVAFDSLKHEIIPIGEGKVEAPAILEKTISVFEPQPLKPSGVKPQVRQATGQYVPEEPTITESEALTQALKRESKAARLAKKETKAVIKLIDKIKKSPIEGMNYEERAAIEDALGELKTARTKEQLTTLYDKVSKLKQIGKEKYIQTVEAERAKFNLDKELLIKTMDVTPKEEIKGLLSQKPSKVGEMAKAARAITLRPARLFDALDGGQSFKGPHHKYFMNQANVAEDLKKKAIDLRRTAVDAKMKEIGISTDELMKTREVEGIKFTVDEMLSIYTGAKNVEKTAAIVYGNKIPYVVMRAVIKQMSDKEKALGNAIISEYEGNYERLRKTLLDYTNGKVDLGKANNYTPIRRTMEGYEPLEEELAKEVLERSNLKKAYAERGFTKERIKNISPEFQRPIKLGEFNTWYEQMEKQEHFINYGSLAKEFQKMANDTQFMASVKEKLGEPYLKELQNWVNRIANPNIYKAYTQADKIVATLRQNAAIAYLGFNLLTMGKQLPSFFLFLEDVGPGPLLSAIHDLSTNYAEIMQEIHDLAPQMKARAIERELEEFKVKDPGRYKQTMNKIGLISMKGITEMDKFVTHSGWYAIYNSRLAEGLSKEEAAGEATMAVLRTQPAAASKDLPSLYASNEFTNIFTQFTNQLNQIYNILTYDIPTQARTGKYMDALRTGVGVILAAVSIALLTKGRFPKDQKEAKDMAIEQGLNYIPFFGRGLAGMRKGYDFTSVPAFAGVQRGGQAIIALEKGKLGKAFENAIETGAVLGGIAGFAQGKRSVKGLVGLIKGEEEPKAIIYGPEKKKKKRMF